jgi:hypothetical protein
VHGNASGTHEVGSENKSRELLWLGFRWQMWCKITGSYDFNDVAQNVGSCGSGRFLLPRSVRDGSPPPRDLRTGSRLGSWTQPGATSSWRVGPTSLGGGGGGLHKNNVG